MESKNFIPSTRAAAMKRAMNNNRPPLKYVSRHLRAFANVAYKSDGDDNDLTPEQKEARRVLGEQIRAGVLQALKEGGYLTKDQVEKEIQERQKPFEGLNPEKIKEFNESKKALEDQLAEQKRASEAQGLVLAELKRAQLSALPDRKTIADQIRAAIKKEDGKDDNQAWADFKAKKTHSFGVDPKGDAGIELRAAATMMVSTNTNGSAFVPVPEVMPGLVDLARNKPFLENYANTSNTNSPRIIWTEKVNPDGNAAFVGEGQLKPLIDFEITTVESYAKKVADVIKVSTEMLDDIDFMAGEIEKELRYKVDIAVDAALLAGTGDGSQANVNLKGLTQYIGGYVLTTVATTTPNNYDALIAAATQVVSLNFDPNVVFINTIDAANMDLVKDSQGRPLAAQYKDASGRVYNLAVVVTNQMPVGSFLLGDLTRFKVRNYKPFAIAYGWENDDFRKNLVTIIGERRLHAFVANNDTAAFVYDTFANVKTAITA